jgi:serine phosphatase RsbU (regulator of sigma subunit)
MLPLAPARDSATNLRSPPARRRRCARALPAEVAVASSTDSYPVHQPPLDGARDSGTRQAANDLRQVQHVTGREHAQVERLWQIIEHINRGVGLEEILTFIFNEFRDLIPYNRVSYAAIVDGTGEVVARFAQSDEVPRIAVGYSQPLAHSSLLAIVRSGQPRIINDLEAYLRLRPQSDGTRRLVAEGMRASLTCPLLVTGKPVGFLFFNSNTPGTYSAEHVDFFLRLAAIVAVVIERGRMYSDLAQQKVRLEEQSRRLAAENRRHESELELARRVQRALIPHALPSCAALRFAMLYEPAAHVGGDLVDCVALGDDGALVYVADAMGHGVSAALVMSVVRTAFHAALAKRPAACPPSPAALLAEVNRTVVELFGTNYVTAVCVHVDCRARAATFALAGHPPALLLRRATGDVTEIGASGIPLGIDASAAYADEVLPFQPGDVLLLYTDAVTEAAAPDESLFGLPHLKAMLRRAAGDTLGELIERLVHDLGRHCGEAEPGDDLTVLAIESPATA